MARNTALHLQFFLPGIAAAQGIHALLIAMAALPATAQTAAPVVKDDVTEVVVVGARAAQPSALDRKKRAKTPTDSIVADDVGAFPDRNLNEAISRIAGVAVSRNEFGEGDGVSIRGNGPDLTRVEIDGMGVQSTKGALATGSNDAGDGRGADMRELPSDLIKSVDVVKGATAEMTEGSLGGAASRSRPAPALSSKSHTSRCESVVARIPSASASRPTSTSWRPKSFSTTAWGSFSA